MAAQQQTLVEWVTELNDILFIQPDDGLSQKAVEEKVHPSLITRINHATYNYDQFKPGLQYARSATASIQDEFSVILSWENTEKPDGVVAVLSKWTIKDKATGNETKKTNVILWEVKFIDGKRMLTAQTEVEVS